MLTLKTNINDEEFNTFVEKSPYAHYMKTTYWGNYKKITDNYAYTTCGLYNDNELVGTALVLENYDKLRGLYLYIPTGMAIDYENPALTSAFLTFLKTYANEKKACFLRIDPDVLRYQNTISGEPLKDLDNHEYVTDYFINNGFKHRGYTYAYDGSWHNRYTLVVDLNKSNEEILKSFSKNSQNYARRHVRLGIRTRIGEVSEAHYLEDFASELAKKFKFNSENTAFFTKLIKLNAPLTSIFITEMHLDEAIASQIADLNSNKYKKDLLAKEKAIMELDNLNKLKNNYGDVAIINAAIYIKCGHKVFNQYNYSNKDFAKYHPTDNVHLFAMDYFRKLGVTTYDLVGFSGVTNTDDPYYNLYVYKSSLGSKWIENIGEFDYVLKPLIYNSVKSLGTIKKKLRHFKKHH